MNTPSNSLSDFLKSFLKIISMVKQLNRAGCKEWKDTLQKCET